ncbi:MAG: hypothetical protein IJG85_04540 [Eubacteriaceae bacterium]|nr:hypothetical protein [Eubacteriaceae bacterium]MBR0383097.1 hypothetical protein [Eubacteriaceae bacterium]
MHEVSGQPILKFQVIGENPPKFVDMELKEFQMPKGGVGICPTCGAEIEGNRMDWTCDKCGLVLKGPIF